ESSCRPRMTHAVLPVGVARNDGEWALYRHRYHLLRVGVNHYRPAEATIPRKALAIQALTGTRPFQLGQLLIAGGFINVLDGRGLNLRHSGIIRIGFCRHVMTASPRLTDHLEHHRCLS